MSSPVARQGDPVQGLDNHVLLVPSPAGAPVPTPTQLPFAGVLRDGLSGDVKVEGRYAALVGSVAPNQPAHVIPPNVQFAVPPANRGTVVRGSATVLVNGKALARAGDPVLTCSESPAPTGTIAGGSATVLAG
jgi:uncharacterized Zn-binding protein involved in type VI secretion